MEPYYAYQMLWRTICCANILIDQSTSECGNYVFTDGFYYKLDYNEPKLSSTEIDNDECYYYNIFYAKTHSTWKSNTCNTILMLSINNQ